VKHKESLDRQTQTLSLVPGGVKAASLGLLGGAGRLNNHDRDGNFLVNRVSVGGRSRFWGVHNFFDNSDLGVFVLVTTLSSHSAVHDNGEDPNHPEENTDSATKNERDGSTLPTTEIHEGVVDALNEGSFTELMVVVRVTMVSVYVIVTGLRVGMMRHIWSVIDFNSSSFYSHVVDFNSFVIVYDRCKSSDYRVDWPDVMMTRMAWRTAGLDEGQAEDLSENVGDLHCFLVEATGTMSAARSSHPGFPNPNSGPVSSLWDSKTETDMCSRCVSRRG